MAPSPAFVTFPPSVAEVVVIAVVVGLPTVGSCTSKAPMSTVPLAIRGEPRWSVAGVEKGGLVIAALLPALMAGLPASRAIVAVGPPLLARRPSFGSAVITPLLENVPLMMVLLWTMFTCGLAALTVALPAICCSPRSLPPMLPDRMLLRRLTVAVWPVVSDRLKTAPASLVPGPLTVLPARVLFVMVTVPSRLKTAPPAP